MLKYTTASINKIAGELRAFAHFTSIFTSVFMILYLLVASILGIGLLPINIILLLLTLANLVVYTVTRYKADKRSKNVGKKVNHAYKITKIILNLLSISTIVYTVAATPEKISSFRLVMLPLMIIVWCLSLIIEVFSLYIESRLTLFVDGIEMDFEGVIRPAMKVKNSVNSLIGEKTEGIELVSEHNRKILKEQAAEDNVKREKKKNELRAKGVKFVKALFGANKTEKDEYKEKINK